MRIRVEYRAMIEIDIENLLSLRQNIITKKCADAQN